MQREFTALIWARWRASGATQKDYGAALGVSQSTLSRWLNGNGMPATWTTVDHLAERLGLDRCELGALVGLTGPASKGNLSKDLLKESDSPRRGGPSLVEASPESGIIPLTGDLGSPVRRALGDLSRAIADLLARGFAPDEISDIVVGHSVVLDTYGVPTGPDPYPEPPTAGERPGVAGAEARRRKNGSDG